MRRSHDRYNDVEPSSPPQSSPDYTIVIRGYNFREGQPSAVLLWPKGQALREAGMRAVKNHDAVSNATRPHQVRFCSATRGVTVAALPEAGTLLFSSAFKGSKETSDENYNCHPRHSFPRRHSGSG
jgi:hypothetical protein